MEEEQDVVGMGIREVELAATEAEAKVGATLSPFEPFSLGTPKSTGEAKLKGGSHGSIWRLKREHRPANQSLDLRLQVRKLEIEAEKEVKLRQLDIEAAKVAASSSVQRNFSSVGDNSN